MTVTTAQTFQIAAPGARSWRDAEANPMIVQGGRVTAELAANGHWTVWAGTEIIAQGDTKPSRDLSAWFFQQVAARWDAQIEKAEIAAAQLAEQNEDEVATEADPVAVIEALGGDFWTREAQTLNRLERTNAQVVRVMADSIKSGLVVEIGNALINNYSDGHLMVSISNGKGSSYGRYYYKPCTPGCAHQQG